MDLPQLIELSAPRGNATHINVSAIAGSDYIFDLVGGGRTLQRGCTAPKSGEATPENALADIEASLAPSLIKLKAAAKHRAAADRYNAEVAGITVSGVAVDTSRESQAKLNAAVTLAQIDSDVVIQWKGSNGTFHTLNASALISLGMAVASHVQTCFSREAELCAEIDACETITELEELDLTF